MSNVVSITPLPFQYDKSTKEISRQTSNPKDQVEGPKTIGRDLISTPNTFPIFNNTLQTG